MRHFSPHKRAQFAGALVNRGQGNVATIAAAVPGRAENEKT